MLHTLGFSLAVAFLATAPPPAEAKVETMVAFGLQCFQGLHGQPTRRVLWKVKNPHVAGQWDTWHRVTYPGLKVEFLRAESAPEDLLSSLTLADPRVKLPFGIALGCSQARVVRILGQPSSTKGQDLDYETGDLQTAGVRFRFRVDRLVSVKWWYEID